MNRACRVCGDGRAWARGLALAAWGAALGAFGDVPAIRFAAEAPFRDGKPVEAVWAKADVCTRFVEVIKNDVVLDQSEARLLFDDKNLYVTLKGWFDPAFDCGNRSRKIGSSNNFEFFIKAAGDSVHVIVDEFARLYVARSGAEVTDHGVTAFAEKAKDCWTANLTIPLALAGINAPTDDLPAKLGIFRQNINVHERQKLWTNRICASGYTPNAYVYNVPDTWADAVMTRKPGEAKRVEGPSFGRRINLFANPEFDIPQRGWNAAGGTTYGETMAMSGEWVYHATGEDYQILGGTPTGLKPNARYTLVVKARSFGAGSGLRVVEMVRGKDGRIHEGTYVTGLTPVGPDMHEYFLPFTSSPDACWTFVFYKIDNRAKDTGLDIASVRLYEGEISTFEIRKLVRPGRMAVVPGTEVAPRPNGIGRFPRRLRVLALADGQYRLREPVEIFAGTGAEVDVLSLQEGKDQDVYSTDGDPATITERLTKGEYDLYMVPQRDAEKAGKELAGLVAKSVRKGAGLYFEKNAKPGRFADLLKEVRDGRLGEGRVRLAAACTGWGTGYLPTEGLHERGKSFLPFDELARAQVAWDAYCTAFGEGEAKAKSEEVKDFVYAGLRHTVVKSTDAAGATVAWRHETAPITGARLGAFADSDGVATVCVEGDCTGLELKWEFRDFSGRILAEERAPAAAKVTLPLPRKKLYTNFGGVRLYLVKGDEAVDVRGECIFERGNDRARLMDDYTPSMWPGNGGHDEALQLQDIGIRASLITPGGAGAFEQTMGDGFAVGDMKGGGDTFCGWPQKSNIREQQFNTAESRARISNSVCRAMVESSKYGVYQYGLCDEPNLSRPGMADELDAHPENLAVYRQRMEAKYGTIAEYNRRHKTKHASFADLDQTLQAASRASGCPAEFIEWRNFNVDRWCEIIKLISDCCAAYDPAPYTMCNSFGQSALSGNDYWKLLTRAGQGISTEYTSMVYFGRGPLVNFDEFIRSFRPDIRCWGWTGYFYTPARARFMPWWFAAHRYGGFSWFAALSPGYNIVDAATLGQTVDGVELKKSLEDSRLLKGLGKVMTCWEWAKRDVAIYYSHDAMLLSTWLGKETKNGEIAAEGPLHDFMYSREGAQYTVEDLLYQYDFVAPEQITEQNRLAKVRALLVPRILAMSDAEVSAVKAFLANGGKMLCDALPGDYDELGVKRAQNPFKGLAAVTVFGKNFDDRDKDCRMAVKSFLESAGATKALVGQDMISHTGREAMHYVSGGADLYAVIRAPWRSTDAEADTFTFVKKGHAYDVVARKYLGETDHVTTRVPLNEASVYAVLPAKIETVRIDVPATVARGEDLKASFAIVADDVTAAYALHVEVVPPSGKARFHFKRNMLTKDGKASLTFPMALNDEPGAWKLRVTEPLTGVTAEKPFTVR